MLDLKKIAFFAALPASELESLSRLVDVRELPAGSIVCRRGEPGKYFFAVASGGVNVKIGVGVGERRRLVFLGTGQVFGEMSLLSGEPVSATVETAMDTRLLVLPKHAFVHLVDTQPRFAEALIKMLVERLRHRSDLGFDSSAPTCAFVVVPEPSEACSQAVTRIHRAVQHYSPASVLVDSSLAPSPEADGDLEVASDPPGFFPSGMSPVLRTKAGAGEARREYRVGVRNERLADLVEAWRDEGSIDQILTVAVRPEDALNLKEQLRPWDVVMVLDGTTSSDVCERVVEELHGMTDFAIVDLSGAGEGRSRWAFRIPQSEVREAAQRADMIGHDRSLFPVVDWIARWVTRREVGFALAAGGARGFAHLGVLQVVEEAGVPIDCIAGTSMGGIVALTFAMAANAHEATAILRDHIGSNANVKDMRWLPRSSLMAGRKVEAVAHNVFGERRIEDLTKPAGVIAADLLHRKRVVLDSGLAREAVLATSAIPGVFPPFIGPDAVMVDGALLSRIPLHLLDKRRCSLRIAVNVAPSPVESEESTGAFRRGLEERFDRVLGFKNVMANSWELLAWWHGAAEAEQADIYLEPNTRLRSGMDFDSFDQMVEAGRRAAEEKMDSIKLAADALLRPGTP